MLTLPLWFITDHDQVSTNEPPAMLAFSSWPKLKAYLVPSKSSAADVVVANDHDELMAVIADVRGRGLDAVYLDPDSDGHGGECILLKELSGE